MGPLVILQTQNEYEGKNIEIPNDQPPRPSDAFADAVDAPLLTFVQTSSFNWVINTTTRYYGSSSVRSGTITHNQVSSFNITLTGPVTLSFYWKVSSESDFDNLNLIINGYTEQWISGEIDWTEVTVDLTENKQYYVKWEYSKDSIFSEGSDCGWVDYIRVENIQLTQPTEKIVLDSNLNFTNDLNNPWTNSSDSKVGSTSLKAQGPSGANIELKTTILGKGILSWW